VGLPQRGRTPPGSHGDAIPRAGEPLAAAQQRHRGRQRAAQVLRLPGRRSPSHDELRRGRAARDRGYKRALAERPGATGKPLSVNFRRTRLGIIRTFFDRIIEWDWPDAPARIPIFVTDLPKGDEPLPKFLDDGDATRLARAIAAEPDPLRRLVLELLRHTGVRVGELCALEADAVVQVGEGWWLRVPVGKLHNDRYVPLLPQLVALLDAWRVTHEDHGTGLLLTNRGNPLNRHAVTRMLNRAARRAGLGHLHPHQLRHTLATQAEPCEVALDASFVMVANCMA
jgi:integrase